MPTFQIPNGQGGTFAETTSTDLQTAFLQQFLSFQTARQTIYTPNLKQPAQAVTVAAQVVFDLPNGIDTITGTPAVSSTDIFLGNPTSTYITGGTPVSTVDAADGVPATIINNSPGSSLLAVTGAAANGLGNTLEGLAGANQFITGNAGRDAVLLNGVVNNLTSNGNDVVLVGGPSTITAAAGGMDNVLMTAGTTLAFVNQSGGATVNSVTGAANGIVLLAGSGNASITSGTGQEFFFVDTSAGNTTLTANAGGTDAFTFIKNANAGTANVQVNGFATNDVVAIHGYAGFTVQTSAASPGGSVLALSDGSRITFSSVAATTLQAAVRTI